MVLEFVSGLLAGALLLLVPGYFLSLFAFPFRGDVGAPERLAYAVFFSMAGLFALAMVEYALVRPLLSFALVGANALLLCGAGLLGYAFRTRGSAKRDAVAILPFLSR